MAKQQINPFLLKKEMQENWSKYLLCSLMLGLTAGWGASFYGIDGGRYWLTDILPFLGAAAAIILGMGSFSLERARGTLLFLLNTPLTRETIYRTKIWCGILLLTGSLLVAWASFFLAARLFGHLSFSGAFAAAFFLTFLGLVFCLQLSIFFSVLSADPVKASIASAFCLFILYSAALLEKTRFISPFYYMRGGTLIEGGPFPWPDLAVLLAANFALYHLGRHIWLRLEE